MNICKEDQIKFLEKNIEKHQNLYYNKSEKSFISDASYDAEEAALRALDPDNKLLKRVGAPVAAQEEWSKAKHEIPMGSLDKVKSPEELHKWLSSNVNGLPVFNKHNKLLITEKIDGLSIEVIYRDGKLTKALTRGDGTEGYEITPNVVRMQGVCKELPMKWSGSLRGEIVLRKSEFEKHFANEGYANTRNAATGLSKRLDGNGCEHLSILFYQAIGDIQFTTECQQFKFIRNELKLQTPNTFLCEGSLDEQIKLANEIWEKYQSSERNELDYELDGLVVRINELKDQDALGSLHMRPHGAMAMKFRAEGAETTVKAINLQVGNSGRITPVLEIETVNLVGAEISRASLYNFGYIKEIGLDVGAKVLIVRANDVIPRCEIVLKPTGTIYQPPTKCPVCNSDAVMNGENLQCINTDTCPAQIIGRLKNWINTLGLLEWGDKLLERLVEHELISNIADLYRLDVNDLCTVERMGVKSATKCYEILHNRMELALAELLGGLSIPMVGVSTIQMLIDGGLDNFDKIMAASAEDILEIKGIGPVKAQSLVQGLARNQNLICNLLDVGISIKENANNNPVSDRLANKTFCITGSTNIKRDDLIRIIKEYGGQFVSSITKDCTHLILADPSKVSSKTKNATKLGISIISEEDFFKLIN